MFRLKKDINQQPLKYEDIQNAKKTAEEIEI